MIKNRICVYKDTYMIPIPVMSQKPIVDTSNIVRGSLGY